MIIGYVYVGMFTSVLENAPCHVAVDRRFWDRLQVLPNRVDRRGVLGADHSVEDPRHDEIFRTT